MLWLVVLCTVRSPSIGLLSSMGDGAIWGPSRNCPQICGHCERGLDPAGAILPVAGRTAASARTVRLVAPKTGAAGPEPAAAHGLRLLLASPREPRELRSLRLTADSEPASLSDSEGSLVC